MAIKKLHVGFDLDVELFARMLMNAGNMKIEVYGDAAGAPEKATRSIKGPKPPKLLAAPKKRSRALGGARKLVLDYFISNREASLLPRELVPLIIEAGYLGGTIHGTLHDLVKHGLVKRKAGRYSITAKALSQTNGATHGEG